MARVANSMVTFQDLDDMVTFEGFSYVTNPITPPSNLNTCATKLDVLGYIDAGLTVTIANNQLVNYSIISLPVVTDTLTLSQYSETFESTNPNQTQVTVTSSTSWSVLGLTPNWINISAAGTNSSNGSFTIALLDNDTNSSRDYSFVVQTDGANPASQTFNIFQNM